ncbi:MAG: polysaccharide deacetylase family protein [Sphingosinicella sp.]|nr:polysaccharide deacetylase family protein [Sphingosinicella sp.]
MKRILIIGAILLVGAVAWYFWIEGSRTEIYRFENVSGPDTETPIANPVPVSLQDFDRGGPNRLAVLVTDPASDWVGLLRGFKSQGISVTFTRDPAKALRHQVIIAYPGISGRLLSQTAIRSLARHVQGGGTLLTFDLAGGGLEELFGISRQIPSRERNTIRWKGESAPEERLSRFSSGRAEVKIGSIGLLTTSAETLASFEDGKAAVVCRRAGGNACLLGVDPGSMAQRAMNGRSELFSPDFVNGYQPSLDIIFRWIRDLYVEGEDDPFLIGTAPSGFKGSLILTHDVDFTRSVGNSVAYADAIRKRGVSATFLIQTKYIRDWNDDVFFNHANLPSLKRVARGMEIGSHSVSHTRAFRKFEMGSGEEYYPRYRPFVESRNKARDGTILGELRVSKYLIEHLVGAPVRSFRPGHLAFPEALPEALAATGYRYSSTLTANSAQTHFPFQLSYSRSARGLLPAWEFPVTIEDEKPPRLGDRLEASITLIDKIAANEGVAVVLIHPDVKDHKLKFEEQLIDRMKGKVWIGSLGAFGDWWSARDQADFDFEGGILTVNAPASLQGVEIRFPKGPRASFSLRGVKGRQAIPLR